VSDFRERLDDLVDARVERVHEFRGGSGRADVTPRQQEALEAALDAGYYEVPRRASVSDVAGALDCATSTAGELLRRAEAGVVAAHVERRGLPGPTP
jgi:predicted DNA binding protein